MEPSVKMRGYYVIIELVTTVCFCIGIYPSDLGRGLLLGHDEVAITGRPWARIPAGSK